MQLRPAEGERRAIRGYSAQYRVIGWRLSSLLGTREWRPGVDTDRRPGRGPCRRRTDRIATIRGAVGLGGVEFAAFVQVAHLDLGFRLAGEYDDSTSDRSDHRTLADLDHLASLLFRLVADERRIIELSAAELIRALGWQRRLDLRFRHEFPVDERLYRPSEPLCLRSRTP
jgi:hypothetical protein